MEDVEDWEKAIQGEILNSLCSIEVLYLDHISNIKTVENIRNTKAN